LIIRKKNKGGGGEREGWETDSIPEGIFGSFDSKFHVTLIQSKKIEQVKTPNQKAQAMDDRPKTLRPKKKN
jgi:hypothetical protein